MASLCGATGNSCHERAVDSPASRCITKQINATGTGPKNAQRELEALAEYGPIPQ